MMVKSRPVLPADPPGCADSQDEDSGRTGFEDERGWRQSVLAVLVVVLTTFPFAILLTLVFQFPGTVLAFLLTGAAGGYLAGPSRSKGFYVGIIGTTIACLSGVVFLLAAMSRIIQHSDVGMYLVSYFLWLNLAAPVNLFLVVIPIGGVGGVFGSEMRARILNAQAHR